jgi:hypothetical protein
VSVGDLQEPKAQVAGAAHTLSVCKRHLAHELLPLLVLLFTTTIDLRLMGTSPDEDLISYVHVAHGLEVSSQTNTGHPPLQTAVATIIEHDSLTVFITCYVAGFTAAGMRLSEVSFYFASSHKNTIPMQ